MAATARTEAATSRASEAPFHQIYPDWPYTEGGWEHRFDAIYSVYYTPYGSLHEYFGRECLKMKPIDPCHSRTALTLLSNLTSALRGMW